MKNRKLFPFLVVLVIVSLSCNYLFPSSTNKTSNGPVIDFEAPAEPLNVTVQLDEASTASSTITPTGGSLSLTAADGTVFTLDVPAKALASDTLITMIAVKSITDAPVDEGNLAAVQLQPSGLFFSDVLTLTIVPAQEIPLENQIIFGYEGAGQDYHLAVVDPKSREIKVLLTQFSGAGVGSGADSAWAANLQVQANATATRLDQKLGEATQVDRKANVLVESDESSNELGKITESILDQYYDQVAVKEMAAAELDCKYAQKAIDDLLKVERLRQVLLYTNGATTIPNLSEKIDKLAKIAEKCKVTANGTWGLSSLSGDIDSLDKPFTLPSSGGPGCTGEVQFLGGSNGGDVSCSQTCEGLYFVGTGSYTIAFTEDGGTISGGCSIYLPASGGLDIPNDGPINLTFQRVP